MTPALQPVAPNSGTSGEIDATSAVNVTSTGTPVLSSGATTTMSLGMIGVATVLSFLMA
jgi:hypothetical protein